MHPLIYGLSPNLFFIVENNLQNSLWAVKVPSMKQHVVGDKLNEGILD